MIAAESKNGRMSNAEATMATRATMASIATVANSNKNDRMINE